MIIGFKHDDDTSILGQLVSLAQKLNGEKGYEYKHCELFFPSLGVAIGARTEEGVKVRPIEKILDKPELWEFYEVPADDEKALKFLLENLDAGYNFGAVIGWYGFGVVIAQKNVFYCSELVYLIVKDYSQIPIDRNLNAAKISPAYLRQLLIKAGASPVTIQPHE